MDGTRFDRITASIARGSTRRRALVGLGLAGMATLVARTVMAQTDEEHQACLADCNAAAVTARELCGPKVKKNKAAKAERKSCLKQATADRKTCRQACPRPPEDEPVEAPT